MAEEKKESESVKKVKWFSSLVENLPKSAEGDSFTNRVIALETAKLATAAGQAAISAVAPQPAGKTGLEKGISEGLEEAGKSIVVERLTGDPISAKVMAAFGDFAASAIKEKMEGGGGGGKASEAEIELARRDRAAELEGMFNKFHADVIAPLAEQVTELTPKGTLESGKLTTDKAVDMVLEAREKAQKLLEAQGFSVENVNVTKADVKKILDEEQTKFDKRLEGAQKEWEEKSGATVELEKDRIRATENFLSVTTDRLFNIFLEPIKDEIHKAIKKGGFKRGP